MRTRSCSAGIGSSPAGSQPDQFHPRPAGRDRRGLRSRLERLAPGRRTGARLQAVPRRGRAQRRPELASRRAGVAHRAPPAERDLRRDGRDRGGHRRGPAGDRGLRDAARAVAARVVGDRGRRPVGRRACRRHRHHGQHRLRAVPACPGRPEARLAPGARRAASEERRVRWMLDHLAATPVDGSRRRSWPGPRRTSPPARPARPRDAGSPSSAPASGRPSCSAAPEPACSQRARPLASPPRPPPTPAPLPWCPPSLLLSSLRSILEGFLSKSWVAQSALGVSGVVIVGAVGFAGFSYATTAHRGTTTQAAITAPAAVPTRTANLVMAPTPSPSRTSEEPVPTASTPTSRSSKAPATTSPTATATATATATTACRHRRRRRPTRQPRRRHRRPPPRQRPP